MRRAEFFLLCLVFAAGCAAPAPPQVQPAAAPAPATVEPVPPRGDVRPVGLSIPAIGVEESQLVPLGLDQAGQLTPPSDFRRVGWYTGSPVPGDPGPAVLAGHVDSRSGPAVFFRLRDLKPGDQVTVRRSDGRSATFRVDTVQRYPKDAFPTAAVYGPAPGSALRLITCGGGFDAAKRSYRDNIVVYASTHWDD
ncbi:Sortase family protein [Amycolatopsis xylanica]|uniref:Sortase family protein n=1 Tax=Amycolatopsis xylanica TaxID=589385 RepID=A0A1H2TN41_9PSEU|nr:class F sortase [Amycolatopsis xylanica]SDW44659.1 Sortase family protein [Amycolatopsis xylanica]